VSARWLNGLGYVGVGFGPSFAPGAPSGGMPSVSQTMTTTKQQNVATISPAQPSYRMAATSMTMTPSRVPVGSGPVVPASGRGSMLPSAPPTMPMHSSPLDPGSGASGGGGDAGGSASFPDSVGGDGGAAPADASADDGTTINEDGTISVPLATATKLDALSRSWTVALGLGATSVLAWFLGRRTLAVVALGGAGFVGYRAWRG